ncbi:MAG TPA: glutamate--tRNA ligase family protein [Allosphingosinicella sp.]|jgi:glutamyl-Q tRNA(Asp) synthetase|nr:glutamate--tRNA ligase family protein [Allosphingosinicella sp.]
MSRVVTRFAPSPTGRLHVGHAYSALLAHDYARERGGAFLLRIEDIDPGRSRAEHVGGIVEDLAWLGLSWDGEIVYQSERLGLYAEALERLKARALVYPCFCTRSAIAAEIAASASAPHGAPSRTSPPSPPTPFALSLSKGCSSLSPTPEERAGLRQAQPERVGVAVPVLTGPDGPLYPGTCRRLDPLDRARRMATEPHAWRLDIKQAAAAAPLLYWEDGDTEVHAEPEAFGDVVLARKDAPVSYHLAVTVDDAAQRVTDVIRGRDLFAATDVHRLLQALLGLPTPHYRHHPLLIGADGRRLAKRSGAPSLAELRSGGADPLALVSALRMGEMPCRYSAGAS